MFLPKKFTLIASAFALSLSLLSAHRALAETSFYALSNSGGQAILKKLSRGGGGDLPQQVGEITAGTDVGPNVPHAVDPVHKLVFFTPTGSTIKVLDRSGPLPTEWPEITVHNLAIRHLEVDIATGDLYFSAQFLGRGNHYLYRLPLLHSAVEHAVPGWNLGADPTFKISSQSRKLFALRHGDRRSYLPSTYLIYGSLNEPQLRPRYANLPFYKSSNVSLSIDFAGDDLYGAYTYGAPASANNWIFKATLPTLNNENPFRMPRGFLTHVAYGSSHDRIVNLAADTVDNKLYWYTTGTETAFKAAHQLYELPLSGDGVRADRLVRGLASYVGQPDYLVSHPLATDGMQHTNRALPFDVNADLKVDDEDFRMFLGKRSAYQLTPKTTSSSVYLDVNNDSWFTPADARLVGDFLNLRR